MIKILFVCHGNICRSPMAQCIFQQLAEEAGVGDRFEIDSAAVSAEELGNGIYPPAERELRRHGVPVLPHRAWQLRERDYERYDLFVVMDRSNFDRLFMRFRADPQGKLRMLMDYTPQGGEVSDPWYTDRFDVAYRDICEGCEALLKSLLA